MRKIFFLTLILTFCISIRVFAADQFDTKNNAILTPHPLDVLANDIGQLQNQITAEKNQLNSDENALLEKKTEYAQAISAGLTLQFQDANAQADTIVNDLGNQTNGD